jgi:hypothetical protein
MNDLLTTMLRDAAARETLPPAPAAKVRRHAEQVRNRRRAGVAALGIAAGIAGGLTAQGTLSPAAWFDPITPSGRNTVSPDPTGAPWLDRPTSPTAPTTQTSTPEQTDDNSGGVVDTAAPWPVPPTGPVDEPWTKPGFDAGRIVAARMEDGHAVITVDRIQFYSAEQWRTKTGESIDDDFRTVNESTRTRQFVIEDDALITVNWQYGETKAAVTLTPRQFVDRTTARLTQLAVTRADLKRDYPRMAGLDGPASIEVFLFHRDRLDGKVAYVEDSGKYTG